jgi:acetyl esterase/lipase
MSQPSHLSAVKRIPDVVFSTPSGIPLYLDIIQPDPLPAEPMPAVIYIHGGGWQQGDRKGEQNLFLAEHGFFTINIEYRLSAQAIFPAQIEDVRAAITWLREHATQYNIDAAHIGVWGHSAGGHLAALLGTSGDSTALPGNGGSPHSQKVQAAIVISGPNDLSRMGGTHDLPDSPEARLLGGPVQEVKEAVRRANPITYIQPGMPPFLLIHGTKDATVRLDQSESLYQALQEVHTDVSLTLLEGEDHIFSVKEGTWQAIEQIALDFFVRCLIP